MRCGSQTVDMASKQPQEPVIGDGTLHIGDRVVYPNQGICRITGVTTKQIAGRDWEVVTLSREEDGATVMVPRAKVMGIGLRKVANIDAIEKVFDLLAAVGDDPQLDWKVRHRENAERMTGGGLFGTVEVLKGLHALSRVRPLPAKERELYDNARHLLVGEIAAATNIPLHVAEDNLDYALWPPEGMKRKGVPLPPATLGPPTPLARPVEDDLGLEDDEEAAAAPAAATPAAEPDEESGEEEAEAPKPAKAAPKAAAKAKAHPAPHAHAPARKAPAKHAPAKKAAPARKPAAKKAPAKKPAARKPKGKR
jgi:RNA polymerase-interacting CarD/CdnL/TRCF family regulator